MRKRKDIAYDVYDEEYVDNEDDERYGEDTNSLKTPVSERLKQESMSIFYSKTMYPTSLGIIQDEDNEMDWYLIINYILNLKIH